MKRLVMMAVAMVAIATLGLAEEAAAPAAAAPAAVKEESPDTGFSFAATVDLYSAYVWRGCVASDEPVWQPGATLSYDTGDYGTLSANVWANFDMTDRNSRTLGGGSTASNLRELDYTLTYAKDLGPVSLSAGHIWYTFPRLSSGQNYFNRASEFFVTAAYNNDIVTPFVKVYYEYEECDGFYGNAGLTKSVDVTDRVAVGAEVSLGAGDSEYTQYYFGEDSAALLDFNAAIFASYALTDNLSVGARLAWMSLLDSDSRNNETYWDEDLLWGGVNLAVSF